MNADQAISSHRALDTDEVTRYARHLLLPGVGRAGQERLATARVLVVGAGGLGSPVLLYLAAFDTEDAWAEAEPGNRCSVYVTVLTWATNIAEHAFDRGLIGGAA